EMSETFKKLTRRQFINSMIISIGIWIMLYSVLYMEIKAMGIDISLTPFLLASTFFLMTSIIPVQGIGGFGTLEGGWAISFMAVGIAKDIAISSGIIMHIISIIYLILIFIIGFTGLQEKQKSDK
ncbi:MAG TPA: lysylphosphatidylglycerol synthase domain-containing protein, partial [Candidatus Methanoperedens sp.]